jgi:IS5 family transposase
MDQIIPWPELAAAVQTAYPKIRECPSIFLERHKLGKVLLTAVKDCTNRGYRYHGRINEVEKAKSWVRAKVEHVFGVIKNIFGFRRTRYRGLAKNLHRLEVTAALTNLHLVRRRLLKA